VSLESSAAKASTQSRIDAQLAWCREISVVRRGGALEAATQRQLCLPYWPEEVRCVPNVLLRSAVFSVGRIRPLLRQRTLLATLQGLQIHYKGERLNQSDLDVWEMVLHLARHQPLGSEVRFSAHSFLKELGRGTGGHEHNDLKEAFARLVGGVIEITWTTDRKSFIGTLVSSYFRDDCGGCYAVIVNEKMLSLYGSGHTFIDWEQRRALGSNSLAKWLHGFYASHEAPYPYKVATLQALCDSKSHELKKFRQMLRGALVHLVEVGVLAFWEIDRGDLVHARKASATRSPRKRFRRPT
jgi:hypothetical protein